MKPSLELAHRWSLHRQHAALPFMDFLWVAFAPHPEWHNSPDSAREPLSSVLDMPIKNVIQGKEASQWTGI